MSYTPYLIANFATGLEKRLQPWLSPDDAQQELFDGFVYRGTLSKRNGYQYYAIGTRGGAPYRESRVIHMLSGVAPTSGVINSSNTTFTWTTTAQIVRGSITVTSSNPLQVLNDDGLGGFTGPGTGTVDYINGSVSVTFNAAPTSGTVLLTYSFAIDEPVMMIATFITATNIKQLVVATLRYINIYDPVTNTLKEPVYTLLDAKPAALANSFFFSWVNYPDAASIPRLIFTNNFDVVKSFDGTTVTDYAYTMETSAAIPAPVTTLLASFVVTNKDRLLFLRTTENGQIYGQRIRVSGTGVNSDDFRTSATGAGFIDIPDGTWINGATFNRDDLIIWTAASTWVLKYTGNDTTPFVLERIDESRGSDATFSAFTYLNRSSAASRRGLIISDGYRVERQDISIPDFTFDEVDQDHFNLCFAGSVDSDRDHYLIYPQDGQIQSTRILTTNYDEDNYSIYRVPISCIGNYEVGFDVTWNDLLIYPTWDALAAVYSNWNSFAYSKGAPITLAGGHHGEIWEIGTSEGEDNPTRIYDITIIDGTTIEVTTDWNNYSLNDFDLQKGADTIYLTGVGGMLEVNKKQYPIREIINNNVFRIQVPNTSLFSAYTSGGTAQRVIPFDALFKKFNPYAMEDRKVRCGWLYMYVDSAGTNLTRNIDIQAITNANPAVITTNVNHNLTSGDQIEIFGIVGMVELNNLNPYITVLSPNTFSLNGIDSSGFASYVSGGFVSVPEPAKLIIEIITNDNKKPTQLDALTAFPYEGNCTNLTFENGSKKWYKVFINQTGQFIQFRFKSLQAGSLINIQATMPGFQPVGRMI